MNLPYPIGLMDAVITDPFILTQYLIFLIFLCLVKTFNWSSLSRAFSGQLPPRKNEAIMNPHDMVATG